MPGKATKPRVRRECTHDGRHEHGTPAMYKADWCRCLECTAACAADWRQRNRLKVYGRYPQMRLPVTGSARRLQALARAGWGVTALEREVGLSRRHTQAIRAGQCKFVTARQAARIAAAFDELWDKQPPADDRYKAGGRTRTIAFAVSQNWAPALAWDEESIEDADAEPCMGDSCDGAVPLDEVAIGEALRGRPVKLTKAERLEAVRRGRARQMTARDLAALLHKDERSIQRDFRAVA